MQFSNRVSSDLAQYHCVVQLLREIYQKRIPFVRPTTAMYYQGHLNSSSSSFESWHTTLCIFVIFLWRILAKVQSAVIVFWSLKAHLFQSLSYFLQATGVTAFAHFDEYLRQQRLEAFVEKFKNSVFHRTYYGYEDEDYDPELWEWDELEEEDEEEESQEVDQGIDKRLMVRPWPTVFIYKQSIN